jgi:hypothetical protein
MPVAGLSTGINALPNPYDTIPSVYGRTQPRFSLASIPSPIATGWGSANRVRMDRREPSHRRGFLPPNRQSDYPSPVRPHDRVADEPDGIADPSLIRQIRSPGSQNGDGSTGRRPTKFATCRNWSALSFFRGVRSQNQICVGGATLRDGDNGWWLTPLSEARFREGRGDKTLWRAFDKAVRRKPLAGAAAYSMEI